MRKPKQSKKEITLETLRALKARMYEQAARDMAQVDLAKAKRIARYTDEQAARIAYVINMIVLKAF
jgi:hypothetical protein